MVTFNVKFSKCDLKFIRAFPSHLLRKWLGQAFRNSAFAPTASFVSLSPVVAYGVAPILNAKLTLYKKFYFQ